MCHMNPMLPSLPADARGRDYHKTMRGRLKTLATVIREKVGDFESCPFADSAPVLLKNP